MALTALLVPPPSSYSAKLPSPEAKTDSQVFRKSRVIGGHFGAPFLGSKSAPVTQNLWASS